MKAKYYTCSKKCDACCQWFETEVKNDSAVIYKSNCCSRKCKFWLSNIVFNCFTKCLQCNSWFENSYHLPTDTLKHEFCSIKCVSKYHSQGERNGMYGKGHLVSRSKNGHYNKGYLTEGDKNGRYNKPVSKETRDKIRAKRIEKGLNKLKKLKTRCRNLQRILI